MIIDSYKKIVIKIGSSSIVNDNSGTVKTKWLNSICKDISKLVKKEFFRVWVMKDVVNFHG